MSQERFLTVPSSGEVARPFEDLLDEATAALPADFPTSAGQVLVALDIDGTILTPAGATPRVLEGIHALAAAGAHVLIARAARSRASPRSSTPWASRMGGRCAITARPSCE